MAFIDNFFVFPQAVNIDGELKCDITEDFYTLFFRDACHTIKLSSLAPNSVTLLLYDETSDEFVQVNNWEEILNKSGLSSQEALLFLKRPSFIQIDYNRGLYFTKVFLPIKQVILNSDTHDFSLYSHFPIDYLHPVDWQYQISIDLLSAEVKEDILKMLIDVIPPISSDDDMFLSYGNETIKLAAGKNSISVPYAKGELAYWGSKPRYRGKKSFLKIEDYL